MLPSGVIGIQAGADCQSGRSGHESPIRSRSPILLPRYTIVQCATFYGQTCPCYVTVIGLLPVPRLCPRFELTARTACLTSSAPATVGRDAVAWSSGATPGHQTPNTYLPTGTSVRYPGTLRQWPPVCWPQPYRRFTPALSKLSTKSLCCRPSNKTVHHMRHCFCTHSSSVFSEIQTKTALLTVTCS